MRRLSILGFILVTISAICCSGENSKTETNKKYLKGKSIYDRTCISCHQPNGKGMEGVFPPLAGSSYLLADKSRAAYQISHGMEGEIEVEGVKYNGIMLAQELNAAEIKAVLDYVLNSWGNKGGEISLDEVKREMEKK